MKLQHFTIITSLCFNVACGGGSSSEENNIVETNISTVPEVTPDNDALNLSVPVEFEFETSRKISFEVYASSLSNKRAFLSIYTDYAETGMGEIIPNHDSRIWIKALNEGKAQTKLEVTNDIKQVLIQIWSDSEFQAPLTMLQSVDGVSEVQCIF